jgi:hypothetical protein
MQTSHLISDTILAVTGFIVFFKYLRKLEFNDTLLWESFVLSVAVAAVFGAIGYTGFTEFGWLGVFFQNVATIIGAISLVAASWYLVNNQTVSKNVAFGIIGLGILLLILKLTLNIAIISTITSIGCMIAIALIALFGILKGNKMAGIWLLAAVIFVAAANFRHSYIADEGMAIDAYHYLLAISLFCFGLAASQKKEFA